MSNAVSTTNAVEYGPWNPGIQSQLPTALLPLSTIFRPENVFTTVQQAHELHELTGLAIDELVVFRPERLLVHEVLIRVTGDVSVPDGVKVEDLGINFRHMTQTIIARHLQAKMPEIVSAYDALKRTISEWIGTELVRALGMPATAEETPAKTTRMRALLDALREPRAKKTLPPSIERAWEREERMLREWDARLRTSDDAMVKAACRALIRVVSAIRSRHGQIWGDATLLAPVAAGIACNDYGSEMIGQLVEPYFVSAAHAEGYHLLPAQERPVVMNTKGASASGKSTMRPLQKKLAGEIGVSWSDFALVSPDIWRKYLLDYGTLGDAFKYAGTFSGKELAIVDHKLDHYMARKAERGAMTHLLIDRFRFDSFAPDSGEAGSNLLTRFGHFVYMFFMITPPHQTVERSWKRGLEFGRYKAVDDLLAHNIEAYTGMPNLFFTWALRVNKSVHYEFLDNSVSFGDKPRTVAFGWNGEMNILDVKAILDVERYRKIDINATRPDQVYANGHKMAAESNTHFLMQCAGTLPVINFAERGTGRIYARLESGKLVWTDPHALAKAFEDAETRAGVRAIAPAAVSFQPSADAHPAPRMLQPERFHTLGEWGSRKNGD